jgi:transposase InsO family protein
MKPHAPASELRTIPLAWPFAQWGLDQVGPLPKSSRGGHTYLLVVVDKFTKWIEAVPVTNQEATTAVKFFESITCQYGVPNSIITDNDTNFTSGEFQEFTKKLGIQIKFTSVAHPKSNGQVKKANGLVCAGVKR